MTETEIQLLQDKLAFAERTSTEATERYFEQQKKIKELYSIIAKYEAKETSEVERAVKATKLETEKNTADRVCDIVDDFMGYGVYECTDRIRKTYKIPTKYGF